MQIFIINLAAAIGRKKFQKQQLKKLGLNFEFFNALTPDDIGGEIYQKHYYDWQRPLRKAEVACYFSHQKLWQKIINNNQPALILEDDVLLSKHAPYILTELAKQTEIDLVNLEVFARKKYVAKIGKKLNDNHQLFRLYQDKAGAGAYVLYPTGAKKLLQCQQKKGIALADAHIHNCKILKSFQVEPALAVQLMFAQYYNIQEDYSGISPSFINIEPKQKQTWFFRLKRIYAQIKLGFYKLQIISKSNKRHIKIYYSLNYHNE